MVDFQILLYDWLIRWVECWAPEHVCLCVKITMTALESISTPKNTACASRHLKEKEVLKQCTISRHASCTIAECGHVLDLFQVNFAKLEYKLMFLVIHKE